MNDPDEDDSWEASTAWSSHPVNVEFITELRNKMDRR